MLMNKKKYRKQIIETVKIMEANDSITPRFTVNAFPLKINGDERFIIHVWLAAKGVLLAEGVAVHNPEDEFDSRVGIMLASSRAFANHAKRLRECAYKIMMMNAKEQRGRVHHTKTMKLANEMARDPDMIIIKEEAHRARLKKSLEKGSVFYCPECKCHFGDTEKPVIDCPHCGAQKSRRYWQGHRLDEYKESEEPKEG